MKPPGRRSKSWTSEDDRRLLELRAEGRSLIFVGVALGRTAGAVKLRLHTLHRRAKKPPPIDPPELRLMKSFNPYEPAILHDRLTDKIETWTGEDAGDFHENAIFNPDGTVEWRQFVFDGWGNVLGG